MKSYQRRRIGGVILLLFGVFLVAHGQEPEEPKAPAAGRPAYQILRYDEDWSVLRNPALHTDWLDVIKYVPLKDGAASSYLSVGGEFRQVYERIQNDNWGGTPYSTNQFNLQRMQLHFDAHLHQRFRLFLQFESGLEEGRKGGPRPIDQKRLDFLNAFADLGLGSSKHPVTLRVGRQELNFGAGRLVAVREGPNVRQSFYGFRVNQHFGKWNTDGFAVRPAADKPGFFDNVPLHTTQFWGGFATRPWAKANRNLLDVYYYGLDRKSATYYQGTARETRHTVGARIASAPPTATKDKAAIFHFDLEAAYQFGSFGKGDIHAWTVATEAGYLMPKLPLSPRLGLRADISSGDKDPKSKDLETFNPLFPIGNYFGVLADTGPGAVNFRDVHPDLRLALPHGVSVDADWVVQWRQSLKDGVYGVPGNLLIPGGKSDARFVGHRPGLEVRWQIDKHAYVQADYGVFFAGPFQRESGFRKNLNYSSVWIGYKF